MSTPEVTEVGKEFERLVAIMDTLRSPGGCPWDGQQTHQSLVRYLIEESYEVVEAIEAPDGVDRALLREELGDVLLQVVFHSRVAAETAVEEGGFTILEVLRGLNEKLERRHPHVFGDEPADIEDVNARWEELKKQEKPERTSAFDGIPPHLPALALAEKVVSKAQKNGVELTVAPSLEKPPQTEAELGQALFETVQRAKAAGLDPERALRTHARNIIEAH